MGDAWEKKHNCNILFRLRSSRVKGQDRLTSDAVSLLSLHTKEREKKEFLKSKLQEMQLQFYNYIDKYQRI